ncbi:phosphoglycerate dehydrogenase [Hydrogenophaga sp. 2FB]|uniref:phosphoglycerate dehydrogenase n=1 Tax=Hydrogenophaga sp. 2FB TaxID=2502187 RepID=UPI0010F5613A|nr:phosphoglycerate dehydrogenase [Hydrogenophaga sp. 2FB]
MSGSTRTRKVVVTQRFFDTATCEFLAAHHCETIIAELPPGKGDGDLPETALQDLLADADGWIVGHAHVTDSLLRVLPRLQVIARRGVGYERVDVEAVRRHGKVATIAVGGNDACVADHALALMLAVAHRLREGQARLGAGDWSIPMGTDLYRKTVGIVGLGRIGRGVVQRLRGFEAHILVCTPTPDEAYGRANGIRYTDLDTLLHESDIVSLHAPLTPETRFIINAAAIEKMKPSAIVINTARGGLVDDRALLAALELGRLRGVGLDVFVSESDPYYRDVSSALIALPQVVATPHSGASTVEGLDRTNLIAAQSIVDVLSGATPATARVVADGRTLPNQHNKGET